MSALVIYALSAGQGSLAISAMPGREGDYAGDLQHIHDWQPGLVITMTTDAELVEYGARHLGTDIQGMGSRWAHLPVADFGAPPPEIQDRWSKVGESARAALAGGGRVLVHCKGGCGRSGMIALRLLVEMGEDRFEALNRLRAVRSCAVETKGQLQWAFEGALLSRGAETTSGAQKNKPEKLPENKPGMDGT